MEHLNTISNSAFNQSLRSVILSFVFFLFTLQVNWAQYSFDFACGQDFSVDAVMKGTVDSLEATLFIPGDTSTIDSILVEIAMKGNPVFWDETTITTSAGEIVVVPFPGIITNLGSNEEAALYRVWVGKCRWIHATTPVNNSSHYNDWQSMTAFSVRDEFDCISGSISGGDVLIFHACDTFFFEIDSIPSILKDVSIIAPLSEIGDQDPNRSAIISLNYVHNGVMTNVSLDTFYGPDNLGNNALLFEKTVSIPGYVDSFKVIVISPDGVFTNTSCTQQVPFGGDSFIVGTLVITAECLCCVIETNCDTLIPISVCAFDQVPIIPAALLDDTVFFAGDLNLDSMAFISLGGVYSVGLCDTLYITASDDSSGAGCPGDTGFIIRTFEFHSLITGDIIGLCEFTYVVLDSLNPQITCPSDTTLQCNIGDLPPYQSLDEFIAAGGGATDDCALDASSFTFIGQVSDGLTCPETIVRTYGISDSCGNFSTCNQTIIVNDTIPPIVSCSVDITIECDQPIPPGVFTATDNCDDTLLLQAISGISPGDCPGEFFISRVWFATDDCGNSSSCAQLVTIVDTTPPVISCPADATVDCNDEPFTGFASVSDNCDAEPFVTFVDSEEPGACPQELTIFRTWFAEDDCGNVSSCVQIIFVDDSTAPTLSVPGDVTIQCGDEPTGDASATDNCSGEIFITYVDLQCSVTVEGFTGDYDFANWTETIPPGGDITYGMDEVTLVSPDNNGCNGLSTLLSITVPENGKIVFTWNYNTVDFGPNYDPFGYNLNGVFVPLTDDNGPNAQSGLAAAPVSAGDVFSFEQNSTDCIVGSGATTVIDFFVYTCAEEDPEDPCNYTIFRCWSAADACSNTAYGLQRIHVEDTTPPEITCPFTSLIIECDDEIPVVCAFATDNCSSTELIATVSDVLSANGPAMDAAFFRYSGCVDDWICGDRPYHTYPFSVTQAGTYIFTGVFDPIGMGSSDGMGGVFVDAFDPNNPCDNYVAGSDDDNPDSDLDPQIIVCTLEPGDYTLVSTMYCEVNDMSYSWTIEYSEVVTTMVDSDPVGECPAVITRTHYATDACGNVASCTQYIYIDDFTAPTASRVSSNYQCGSQVPPPNPLIITDEMDNCDSDPTVTFLPQNTQNNGGSGCPDDPLIVTRFYSVTDNCDNSTIVSHTITILDDTPPTITCPEDIIAECTSVPEPNPQSVLASDNCATFVFVTWVGDETQQDGCAYHIIRTYSAEDLCGNSATCTQIIMVGDTQPPTITCPDDATVECSVSNLFVGLLGSSSEGVNPGSSFAVDSTTGVATLIGPNGIGTNGNKLSDIDVDPATGIIYAVLGSATSGATLVTIDPNTGAATVVGSFASGSDALAFGPDGTLYAGAWSGAGYILTLDKSNATVLNSEPMDGGFFSHIAGLHVAPDGTLWASRGNNNAGSIFSLDPNTGTTLTVLTLVDGNGNQDFAVVSDLAFSPAGTLYAALTQENQLATIDLNTGLLTRIGNFGLDVSKMSGLGSGGAGFPIVADNCDDDVFVTYSDIITNEECEHTYTIERTWTAMDDCGNVASCVQLIIIDDTIAPDITCSPDITIECSDPVPPGVANATDNCDPEVLILPASSITPGDCIGEYVIFRSWVATDDCGNTAMCEQTVTIIDTTPPQITCPPDITWECNVSTDPSNTGTATAIDNCDMAPVVAYDDISEPGACSTITRIWTATDDCGNASTCAQIITVEDDTAPDLICPANVTVECDESIDPSDTGTATATDFCDPQPVVDFADVAGPGICHTITRTWTAIDACGNSSSCTQIITVDDNTPPTIFCPPDVTLEGSESTDPADTGIATASDNCDAIPDITYADYNVPGPCSEELSISRVWTATDDCGNTSQCTQTLHRDDEPPVPVCRSSVVVSLNIMGMTVVPAGAFDGGSFDNCGPVYFKVKRMTPPDSFDCIYDGNSLYQFDDYIKFCCEDVGNENLMVILRVYDVEPIPGIVSDDYLAGHFADCMLEVEVQDKLPPGIICPSDLTVSCIFDFDPDNLSVFGDVVTDPLDREKICIEDPGNPWTSGLTCIGLDGLATDNCEVTVTDTAFFDINICGTGSIRRIFTATDAGGFTATCEQVVTIIDYTPFQESDIAWPPDYPAEDVCEIALLDPEDLPPPYNHPLIEEDECAMITFTHQDLVFDFSNSQQACFKILRTWTVLDWCQYQVGGGLGIWTRTQIIKVINTVGPQINLTDDAYEICTDDPACGPGNVTLEASATDDCSAPDALRWTVSVDEFDNGSLEQLFVPIFGEEIEIGIVLPLGTHRILYSVEDFCGNVTTEEQYITVESCKPPSAKCLNLTTTLMPVDTDGDLEPDWGMVTIWASDFDAGSDHACGNPIQLAFSSDPDSVSRIFDCNDLGDSQVELWVIDNNGNTDFCTVTLTIQDNFNVCPEDPEQRAIVEGTIATSLSEMVPAVTVNMHGSNLPPQATDTDGHYAFPPMSLGGSYRVEPVLDIEHKKGVSTLDLILLQKHLLGVKPLKSPYQIIAGDANRSANLSAMDIVVLRRLILGITDTIPNNTSWRFVDAAYQFSEPENPLSEVFPESYEIGPLSGDMNINFIALKVGDLNGSVMNDIANNSVQSRNAPAVVRMHFVDQYLKGGQTAVVEIMSDQLQDVEGMQFTLGWNPQLIDVTPVREEGILTEMHWNSARVGEGILPVSWTKYDVDITANKKALLTLQVTPKRDMYIGQAGLSISDKMIVVEGQLIDGRHARPHLEIMPMNSETDELIVYQNRPNPFSRKTMIPITLPDNALVSLEIFNIEGKVVLHADFNGMAGYNEFLIDAEQLGGQGVYTYTISTATEYRTLRMIVVGE